MGLKQTRIQEKFKILLRRVYKSVKVVKAGVSDFQCIQYAFCRYSASSSHGRDTSARAASTHTHHCCTAACSASSTCCSNTTANFIAGSNLCYSTPTSTNYSTNHANHVSASRGLLSATIKLSTLMQVMVSVGLYIGHGVILLPQKLFTKISNIDFIEIQLIQELLPEA